MPERRESSWPLVQRFMQQACGVVMRDDQAYLLEARLGPVARRFDFSTVSEYVVAACSSPGGDPRWRGALLDAMATHETLFFRDAGFWSLLERDLLPRLAHSLLAVSGRRARIWCAACSSGQEPYSVAMTLEESFPELALRTDIIATDVAEHTIERAREARYTPIETSRGLSTQRLVRHFEPDRGAYRVKSSLRERVKFGVHNLIGPDSDPIDCDLVLCRNVLIYFGASDRATVLGRLWRAVKSDGCIGVGATESISGRALGSGWYANEGRRDR